jgi:hypothetical protein
VEKILLTFLFVKGSKKEIAVAMGADDFTTHVATVNPVAMARFESLVPPHLLELMLTIF